MARFTQIHHYYHRNAESIIVIISSKNKTRNNNPKITYAVGKHGSWKIPSNSGENYLKMANAKIPTAKYFFIISFTTLFNCVFELMYQPGKFSLIF